MNPETQSALPNVDDMSSTERVNAILELRQKRVGGTILSEDEVVYAVRLLRAERTVAAKKRNKTADDPGPRRELSDF